MAERYKVTIQPLSVSTQKKFTYESGRNPYTYGQVDLNEFVDKEEASEMEERVKEAMDDLYEKVEGDIHESLEWIIVD